jgi:hypothetical protein
MGPAQAWRGGREPGFSGAPQLEREQRAARHAQFQRASAAVHQAAHGQQPSSLRAHGVHHLPGGAAGRDHVLGHDRSLARLEPEAAAQRHRTVLPLGEERPAAQGARQLVPHQHAAQRGRDHRVRPRGAQRGPQRLRQLAAQPSGQRRVHQHARALQVARGV